MSAAARPGPPPPSSPGLSAELAVRVPQLLEAMRSVGSGLELRDRIARDLHDLVIQRLFATGMMLESAQRGSLVPEVRRDVGAGPRPCRTGGRAYGSPSRTTGSASPPVVGAAA